MRTALDDLVGLCAAVHAKGPLATYADFEILGRSIDRAKTLLADPDGSRAAEESETQPAIDAALYELHVAALAVSTDLAQNCLEDPIGWHEREKEGWRQLAVGASNRLRDALAKLPTLPDGYARAAEEWRALDACYQFIRGDIRRGLIGGHTSPCGCERCKVVAAIDRARGR